MDESLETEIHHAEGTAETTPDAEVRICNHWLKGCCRYEESCKFAHPPELKGSKVKRGRRGAGTIKAAHTAGGKDLRQTAFRRFLLGNLGLSNTSRLVEVAGGKGELGLELLNLHQIDACNVEPRDCQQQGVAKFTRKLELGMFHRSAVLGGEPSQTTEQIVAAGVRTQPLYRCFVKPSLLSGDIDDAVLDQMTLFQKHFAAGSADRHSGVSIPHGKVEVGSVPTEAEVVEGVAAVRDAFASSTHIVAMHPDEPTELIVDYCLAHNKAFAVVPCCVFAEAFPDRVLRRSKEGSEEEEEEVQVRSHEDFVAYLLQKSPEIKSANLPIAGRSTVVFRV